MKRVWVLSCSLLVAGCDDNESTASPTSATGMSFFVTSATSVTGNLGGLSGADATCQRLAGAVGEGARVWRAYLSVEHDALTGSNADGTLMAAQTCSDWTSAASTFTAQVGHTDGLGPGQSAAGALASWNSAHANQNCANTAPRGGAGRFYCFAR